MRLKVPLDRVKGFVAQVVLDFACVVQCGFLRDAQAHKQLAEDGVALVDVGRDGAAYRRLLGPLTLALLAGSSVAIVSAVLIARALGASAVIQASLAPKSVTTPIAMGIAEKIGGLPSLTAVLVIFTGILGAALGPALLRRAGLMDPAGNGFAMGIAAHGVGTARAFQLNEQSGAFAALAMGLNGLFTAVLLPAVAHWLL